MCVCVFWCIGWYRYVSVCVCVCVCECVCVCVCTQLQLTFLNLMDCSLPGSFVHVIFQARILEWVAISYSSESSQPRYQTCISCISWTGRWVLYHGAPWEARCRLYVYINAVSDEIYKYVRLFNP